ncbi:enterobactin synthase subunit F [Chania multitudinisentens RB-25]|uniref:Enterobactin synthase subunit F n=1 Tax=Chania multitudinisentens RB-25 TaxID=1441930 RepID=A0A0D4ZXH9_9GAMM|nr:enterobactin synthase subunit F [Chania multitudinisentens]AJW28917.1 enterobactin synthase subunit F [Chania multitudinisentens RB-25]
MSETSILPTEQQVIVELPLVAAQPGIWVADQISPYGNAYAVAHYIELNGPLDKDCLLQAIAQGLSEVDTLRLRFAERDGVPVQWYDGTMPITPAEWLDLSDAADPEAAATALMQIDLAAELRVSSGKPLYRHILLRLSDQRWFWYQRYHHLVVDGFSFTAIARRIANIYTRLCQQQPPEPTPFTPFSDVVAEYQQYQQSPGYQRDADFWLNKARQLPVPATLCPQPLAGQAPSTRIHRLAQICAAQDFAPLVKIAQQHQLNAADMAMALVALWVARLSGQPSFSAGFIFMRRMGSAALCATGPVINVLPMAIQVAPEATLAEIASQIGRELKIARRHQRYDAEQVQRDLGRIGDAQPLYGTVFNFKMFDYQLNFNGIEGITHDLASGPVRDLEIALFIDAAGTLKIELLANAERYQYQELAEHLQRLPLLLSQFTAQPDLPVSMADLLTEQDHALLARVNDTQHPVAAQTLSGLLAEQARKTPDAPALADGQYRFSYQETRAQVAALAQRLVVQGVQPGDIVAVALPRSVFLSLALMAIVEAGAAYLPLDTGYPDERLSMMLEDAAPRLIITDASQQPRFAGQGEVLLYDAPLATDGVASVNIAGPTPHHAAYIIFTSGSTGRPKGVLVGHQAIVNRLLWMQHQYPLAADDVVLQKTPCSFDVSVWEFFWPLMVGAQLVMAPPEAHRDPQQLLALIEHHQVTTLHFVPSMLAAFVGALDSDSAIAHCQPLRQVFCSGEALPAELCRLWQSRTAVPLHNLYGPTEAAVDVTWHPAWGAALAAVNAANVPIGLPVWNTGLRILDARLRAVPPGVAGDLYLTGVQLAYGYLGRPDLTASRFVADPQGNGGRMYRTGDVARWLADGSVEYLGRSDDQLKIRGQRIELSEIDHALLSLPGVNQAVTHALVLENTVADAMGGDARQLVGYLVAQPEVTLDLAGLRTALAERLPPHMVPVALVELAALPLSANGKLDRKALPQPQTVARKAGRAAEPGLESAIAAVFSRLLQHEPVFADDDFFALGGHSLLAMRLAAELRRDLGKAVSVGQVMVASKVEQLAELLAEDRTQEEADRCGFESLLPLRVTDGPTLFCLHPASGFSWQFSVLPRYIDQHWSLVGIQSPRPDGPLALGEDMDQVCDAHLATVLQVQPHGPYHFIGYSLGGTLAQGIAARLQARGEEVAFLGLLDTYPPETQNWDVMLDDNVLKEVQREREQFLAVSEEALDPALGATRVAMFDHIEANYADSVRLLSHTHTARFHGQATLFVAKRTLQAGMDVQKTWAEYVDGLQVHELDCAHVDIVSPASFKVLGPLLNRVLRAL